MGIIEAIAIGIPGGPVLGAVVYAVFRPNGPHPYYTPRPARISLTRFPAAPQTQPTRGLR